MKIKDAISGARGVFATSSGKDETQRIIDKMIARGRFKLKRLKDSYKRRGTVSRRRPSRNSNLNDSQNISDARRRCRLRLVRAFSDSAEEGIETLKEELAIGDQEPVDVINDVVEILATVAYNMEGEAEEAEKGGDED